MINITINAILPAFIGGLLIGLASTLHLYLKGRITGMSGIFNGVITFDESLEWKSSLMSGLVFTSCLAYYIYGFGEIASNVYFFDSPELFSKGLGTGILILAGLLVGFGTRLGNGCTSGHGVCGLPRLSIRSFVAVMTFMTTGIIMAQINAYFREPQENLIKAQNVEYSSIYYVHAATVLSVLLLLVNVLRNKKGIQGVHDIIISFIIGAIFSLGLLVSGMSRRSKVLGFLTFNKDWDISLMFVMGGAVLLNIFTFNYIINKKQKPIYADKLCVPTNKKIDWKLVVGAAIFGLGWGLGGICPGPAIIITPVYFFSMIKFIVFMAIGQYSAMFIENKLGNSDTCSNQPIIGS